MAILNKNDLSKYVFINKDNKNTILLNLKNQFSILIENNVLNNKDNKDELYSILEEYDFLKSTNEVNNIIDKFKIIDNRTLSITIFVHGNCNFRCEYCYEKFNNRHIDNDKENKILKFIEEKIKEANFERLFVSWFGGEPLLAFNTIYNLSVKLKKLADKYSISYSSDITTNAYLLTIDRFVKLINLNVRSFQITVDGDKEYHNNQRHLINGMGTYNKILKNLYDIQNCDKKFEIMIRSNISKENYSSIKKFLETDACKFKDDERFVFFFKAVGNWGLGIRENNTLSSVNINAEIDVCKYAINLGYKVENIDIYLSFNNICPSRSKNYYAIDVDGKILKCTTIKLYDDNNVIGNINNLSLNNKRKMWEDYYEYNDICLECKYFPVCRGGSCPVELSDNENQICLNNKNKFNEYLKLFFDLKDCNLEIME